MPLFRFTRRLLLAFGRSALVALLALSARGENAVLEWNELLLDAIRAANSAPTLAARNIALLHTAIYDAVNAIDGSHQPYRFNGPAPSQASSEAVAVGAAFAVGVLLYPEYRPAFDAAYVAFARETGDTPEVAEGLQFGRLVGQLAVDSRSADGSSTQVPYIPSELPGQWRRTPPFFRPPVDSHWGSVDPFCLTDPDEFLPPGPPALESGAYAADVNQVKELGGSTSVVRTAEQSELARFWSDFSYTQTPPGHWMDIASAVAQSRGLTVPQTARLCALVALAQADAAIVVWRAKFIFNSWRPVTAIARADEDANPATEKDTAWQSFLVTPAFPEYVSGHSTFSMASAVVLGQYFGSDEISFSVGSDAMPGVTRQYDSFRECADEIGMSRIYGGIHFMSANRDGKTCGARIAEFVFGNYLLPNASLPLVTLTRINGGGRVLRAHARFGSACVVEASSDLISWRAVSTNSAVVGGATVTLPDSLDASARFYRAVNPISSDD